MKRIIVTTLTLAALLQPTSVRAQVTKYIVLSHTDGTEIARFPLMSQPVVTFSERNIIVTCQGETLSASLEGLMTSFEDVTAGIRDVKLDNPVPPQVSSGAATFEGLKPGEPIIIYDISGNTLGTYRADREGKATVHLNTLRRGLFILRTPNNSYKITVTK